jgi:hypothetical protein
MTPFLNERVGDYALIDESSAISSEAALAPHPHLRARRGASCVEPLSTPPERFSSQVSSFWLRCTHPLSRLRSPVCPIHAVWI